MPLFLTPPTVVLTLQNYSGSYTGKQDNGTIRLRLQQAADGNVTGSFHDGSTETPLSGKVSDDGKKLVGEMRYQGIAIPIEIRRKGSQIEFVLKLGNEEEAMTLSRDGGAAPPETAPVPSKPAPKPQPTSPPKVVPPTLGGNRFVHPAGVTLPLPAGWSVQSTGPIPFLLPPGATKPDGDELYVLLVGEANGIQSKTDPRLTQFIDLLLNGTTGEGGMFLGKGVTFRRTGEGEGGLTYAGGNAGQLYTRCLFSEPKGRIMAVIALGLKTKIQPREAALQKALAAMVATTPERDTRLVGGWSGSMQTKGRDARDAVGRLQASSVSERHTSYQIAADGRYVESRTSRTIALGQGVSIDSGDNVERTTGLWAAGNGKLAFCDENGLYVMGTYRLLSDRVVIELADRILTLTRGQ